MYSPVSPVLRAFQRRFLAGATGPGIRTAVLSLPRANGKSWLAGHLLARALTPGDALFQAGSESVLCASTLEQARIVFRFAKATLPEEEYDFRDNSAGVGIIHRGTGTRLRCMTSNARAAFGLVNTPVAVCDEPGAWFETGGAMMHDAIQTAMGKPGSPLRAIYIGTLAPARSGWWHDLVKDGSSGSVFVQSLQGDRDTWDTWKTIRAANPLTAVSGDFRAVLLEERDKARADSRLKARFLSYRLNLPSGDESQVLLAPDDWMHVSARPVPERSGRPIVGIDLGQGRSWSAAVALWSNGRAEAMACAPGIPDLEAQEKRDHVQQGLYRSLEAHGQLEIAHGLRVQPPAALWDGIRVRWGIPQVIICDRFRLGELEDAIGGSCVVQPRATRWSEAAADIRSLQKLAKDGPLAIHVDSRALLAASISRQRSRATIRDRSASSRRGSTTPEETTSPLLCCSRPELSPAGQLRGRYAWRRSNE